MGAGSPAPGEALAQEHQGECCQGGAERGDALDEELRQDDHHEEPEGAQCSASGMSSAV